MLGGIFVGGASSRMRTAKGLLRAPSGDALVVHVARVMREAGVEPVLVGARAEYASLGIRTIADAFPNAGPLGGLVALLEDARSTENPAVIAIACDMPYVDAELVKKLASGDANAAVVAPKRDGRWEPLFARYDASRVAEIARARCARGELALQGLLNEVGATTLALTEDEMKKLTDWDTPDDVGLSASTIERRIIAVEGTSRSERIDRIAVEEPLEIRSGREAIAVTMRTPGADVELAAGFLLGEGIVQKREEILSIAPLGPSTVTVDLADAARARLAGTERRFFITSSCGICGKSSIDRVRATLEAPVDRHEMIDAKTIMRLPSALRDAQAIFDRTGALHGAGLFDLRGELMRAAEDVGRHNAVDKVIGAELLSGRLPLRERVLVLSGRVAFELVQKAALAGAAFIVAIGAPTSLAVELAEASNITLIGFARDGRFNVYAGGARVIS